MFFTLSIDIFISRVPILLYGTNPSIDIDTKLNAHGFVPF